MHMVTLILLIFVLNATILLFQALIYILVCLPAWMWHKNPAKRSPIVLRRPMMRYYSTTIIRVENSSVFNFYNKIYITCFYALSMGYQTLCPSNYTMFANCSCDTVLFCILWKVIFVIKITEAEVLVYLPVGWFLPKTINLEQFLPPAHFWKTAGGIVLGSVAVSAVPAVSSVSADVLPYILVAIKASFLKFGMCNICKNNIAKIFLDFFKI